LHWFCPRGGCLTVSTYIGCAALQSPAGQQAHSRMYLVGKIGMPGTTHLIAARGSLIERWPIGRFFVCSELTT